MNDETLSDKENCNGQAVKTVASATPGVFAFFIECACLAAETTAEELKFDGGIECASGYTASRLTDRLTDRLWGRASS